MASCEILYICFGFDKRVCVNFSLRATFTVFKKASNCSHFDSVGVVDAPPMSVVLELMLSLAALWGILETCALTMYELTLYALAVYALAVYALAVCIYGVFTLQCCMYR